MVTSNLGIGSAAKCAGASALLDFETVDASTDLVARMHLRVSRGQRVEEGAVAAAEIADADGAVFLANDFEVTAREEFIGDAHVSLAADHETSWRHFELLPGERPFETDQNGPRCSR